MNPTSQNQGKCASCWAFTATAGLESFLSIHTGISYDLSEQFLL